MSEKSHQLDTLETTALSRPPQTYRDYCQSHCLAELIATREVYQSFDIPRSAARLDLFDSCRSYAWFARNKLTGLVRVLSSSCKLRWCPMCASTRRWFLTQQVAPWLMDCKKPKFLTLTLAHTNSPISSQIDYLYKCFRKLRNFKLLKDSIVGGIWFFQIKKSKADELWHPHLHCVIDSEYMDKFLLSAAWAQITKTSKIVDIKTVTSIDEMAKYVARYAARPSILSELDPTDRLSLVSALHGRRLVGTWGSGRSISLRPVKPPDSDDWVHVGNWQTVVGCLDSDYRARAIWRAYQTDTPLPGGCSLRELENEINNIPNFTNRSTVDLFQMLIDFY